MKKIFMILVAFSLLTACKDKNQGGEKKIETKPADDYRSGDDKKGDAEKKETDEKDNKTGGFTEDNNKTNDNKNITGGGWPKSERDAFMSSCVEEAVGNGNSRQRATSYCRCMMDKLESLYPDINEASKLSEKEIESVMMKFKDGCLEQ